MPIPALLIAGVAMQGASAAFAMGKANKMNTTLTNLEDNITNLANSRQDIPDLTAGLEDLSGMITNPYANLSVATKAAEIQMEQTDLALANTLDMIRQSGASAGGATALAREAAKSKQKISAELRPELCRYR